MKFSSKKRPKGAMRPPMAKKVKGSIVSIVTKSTLKELRDDFPDFEIACHPEDEQNVKIVYFTKDKQYGGSFKLSCDEDSFRCGRPEWKFKGTYVYPYTAKKLLLEFSVLQNEITAERTSHFSTKRYTKTVLMSDPNAIDTVKGWCYVIISIMNDYVKYAYENPMDNN